MLSYFLKFRIPIKQIAIIFFYSFFLTPGIVQSKTYDFSKTIKEQAETMGQFLLKKDFSSFSKYTYPAIMEMVGGKHKMIEVLEKGSNEMHSNGMAILSISFGEPSVIITNGNELQSTLPQTIEMKVPNGRLIVTSSLIAISIDMGKNWYFVDTSDKDIQTMKKTLPNLSGKLIIPVKTQPIFYPD